MATTTYVLSAVGASKVVPIDRFPQGPQVETRQPVPLQPTMFMYFSSDWSGTYLVEVTADDVAAAGYDPTKGNWTPYAEIGTGNPYGPISVRIAAVRCRILTYTAGSLTFQVSQ